METHPCPKCSEPMDEGEISAGNPIDYVSQKQSGMVRKPTTIQQARACPKCGYVEMYLDPKELRSRLS